MFFFNLIKKFMVELDGIEPTTFWMPSRRSPNWATAPFLFRLFKSPTFFISSPAPDIAPPIVPQLDRSKTEKTSKYFIVVIIKWCSFKSSKHYCSIYLKCLGFILHLFQFQQYHHLKKHHHHYPDHRIVHLR